MGNRVRASDVFGLTFLVVSAVHCSQKPAVAGNTPIEFALQPVVPQTLLPSSYPPGTTINGREIVLGSVPARVWLEVQLSGGAPDHVTIVQVTISATDPEQDGGGYLGSNADCLGVPANGGNLLPALQPCNAHSDCRIMSGPACNILEVSRCTVWDGVNPYFFPAGQFCTPGFVNLCHSGWIGTGILGTWGVEMDGLNFRYGFAADPGELPIDHQPSYLGTLVLDVPADAKGTYTIDFDETQTFYWTASCPPTTCDLPIAALYEARITVPCGRCCYDLGSGAPQCVDHVSANECAEFGAGAVFHANEVCPAGGGPACPECGLNEHCDDGVFCNGFEVCEANACGPSTPPCQPYEDCEEARAACSPRIPAVSEWGLLILGFSLLILAKLRRKPVETG